eukprot:18381-Eustigmatos_ZCMA.PRE.1
MMVRFLAYTDGMVIAGSSSTHRAQVDHGDDGAARLHQARAELEQKEARGLCRSDAHPREVRMHGFVQVCSIELR